MEVTLPIDVLGKKLWFFFTKNVENVFEIIFLKV
jgi:hypothetical protein